jgi:hypothetical protein
MRPLITQRECDLIVAEFRSVRSPCMALSPMGYLKDTIEADAKYSNTLTRDCPLKRHYTHRDPRTEFQEAPVARPSGTMVGSFVFHRVAATPLDRRQRSQKKNWSLRRHDGLLLHVSCYPDPLCVRQVFLYALLGLFESVNAHLISKPSPFGSCSCFFGQWFDLL